MDIGERYFSLSFPLNRVHLGLPMANADLGVLVCGSGRRLELVINLASCWDHRNSQRFELPCPYDELVDVWRPDDVSVVNQRLYAASTPMQGAGGVFWRATRVPGGRLVLTLAGDLLEARLQYATGLVTVTTTAGKLQLGLTPGRNRLYVLDPEQQVLRMESEPMWQRLEKEFAVMGYEPPQTKDEPGQTGWFQPCPADPGTLAVMRKTSFGYCLAAERSNDGQTDELDGWEEWSDAKNKIADWWRQYWSRQPEICLPEEFWNDFYLLALYKFACATMPGGWPAALQGPWLEDYQRPPWSCDYHFNVNIQQIYALAFATGNLEHMLPLFDMLEKPEFQDVMRQNAKAVFDIDDGFLLTHAVDDRGWQVCSMTAGATLDFTCGGWVAWLYWNYYRFSGDRDFLRNRALPFMRGVMRVYQAALREHQGRLSIPLSISAEFSSQVWQESTGRMVSQNTGRDPSNQLTSAHMLANALLTAYEDLGLAPEPGWLELKKRLPRFSCVGEGAGRRVAVWEGQDLDLCHRHHSHLAMVYPFDLTGEMSAEEESAVNAAVDHWISRGMGQWSEWCYPWAMQIQMRCGFNEAPAVMLQIWRRVFLNESMSSVYLPRFQGLTAHRRADMLKPKETNEVMQLEGTMAGATALIEMLILEKAGEAHLFAGIPEYWRDAAFTRVQFPGGFQISAQSKDGKTVFCKVEAKRAGKLKICLEPGSEIVEVSLEAGETKLLRP